MLSETEVIVRATRSRVASVPGELSFSVGDVIVYLPQRGRSGATGMAMGRLGAGEGLFPPSFTELANDSSVSAPAAHPLALEPDAGGASSAIDQQRGMPILPQGPLYRRHERQQQRQQEVCLHFRRGEANRQKL